MAQILRCAVACVVTEEEDDSLPRRGNGWERYIGRVRVFDRLTQDWADLAALAASQT